MRIKWRGLELPGRVVLDESVSTDSYGRFTIEPFEQGFGTTIGNSLRRVLLSSLEGAAVTAIKIDDVAHEFTNIEGVLEDITDIVLNVKGIIVSYDGEGPIEATVERTTKGEIRAGDIVSGPSFSVVDPDHLIATLTSDVNFRMEMAIGTGRGYAMARENRTPEQEIGVIPVDSVFSPVLRVRYRTQDMRVDDRTNYDRLILEVWTKGTVQPVDALVEASMILRKHLNPFVLYHDIGQDTAISPQTRAAGIDVKDQKLEELLNRPVTMLNLSVRASNCLEAARILLVRDLVSKNESELLRVRSFGRTSMDEVERKLSEYNLYLGMSVSSSPAEGAYGAATPPELSPMTMPPTSEAPSGGSDDSSGESGLGPMEVFTMGD